MMIDTEELKQAFIRQNSDDMGYYITAIVYIVVQKHYPTLLKEHYAEDIKNDAILKVWENQHKADKDTSLFNWIYSVAKNEINDIITGKHGIPPQNYTNFKDDKHMESLLCPTNQN